MLDKTYCEKQLCTTLEELRDEIHTHMDITEELTNKARGNNKSYLTAANGKDQLVTPWCRHTHLWTKQGSESVKAKWYT